MNLFAILIGFGATLGLANVAWHARRTHDMPSLVTAGLLALLGALLGGRLGYGVANWAYFRSHLADLPRLWLGGLSAPGALAGGLLALPLASWWLHLRLPTLADRLVPLLPPLAVFAWLAGWAAGVAYGPLSGVSALGLPARDEWGFFAPRLPLQLAGALITLALLGWLESRGSFPHRPGMSFSLAFLAVVIPALGVSFARVDPTPLWSGLRSDTWGYLGLSLAGLMLLALSLLLPQMARPVSTEGA